MGGAKRRTVRLATQPLREFSHRKWNKCANEFLHHQQSGKKKRVVAEVLHKLSISVTDMLER